MVKRFDSITAEDGTECAVVPMTHYEGLLDFRDEYGRHLTAEHKNLHGYDDRRFMTVAAERDQLKKIVEAAWHAACLDEKVNLHGHEEDRHELSLANLRLMVLLVGYYFPNDSYG
jgi:hypothetical protein